MINVAGIGNVSGSVQVEAHSSALNSVVIASSYHSVNKILYQNPIRKMQCFSQKVNSEHLKSAFLSRSEKISQDNIPQISVSVEYISMVWPALLLVL